MSRFTDSEREEFRARRPEQWFTLIDQASSIEALDEVSHAFASVALSHSASTLRAVYPEVERRRKELLRRGRLVRLGDV